METSRLEDPTAPWRFVNPSCVAIRLKSRREPEYPRRNFDVHYDDTIC